MYLKVKKLNNTAFKKAYLYFVFVLCFFTLLMFFANSYKNLSRWLILSSCYICENADTQILAKLPKINYIISKRNITVTQNFVLLKYLPLKRRAVLYLMWSEMKLAHNTVLNRIIQFRFVNISLSSGKTWDSESLLCPSPLSASVSPTGSPERVNFSRLQAVWKTEDRGKGPDFRGTVSLSHYPMRSLRLHSPSTWFPSASL